MTKTSCCRRATPHRAAWCAALFLLLTLSAMTVDRAEAELRIDITQGLSVPMPIAVTRFSGEAAELGRDIADVISTNLERSGLFAPIDPKAFIRAPASLASLPRFADWQILNAQALVQGAVTRESNGQMRVEFRLWEIHTRKELIGQVYVTTQDNWRRVAHIISDHIYERVTGETGYFDTRIVYIAEDGPPDRRIKRLAIMDQDSADHRYLTDGKDLVLTPRFSPTAHEITYLAYYQDRPRVYLYNIDTGQQEVLGEFPGMTYAPRFSPDGTSVIMSMAQNGVSDIYTMDLATRAVRQLTDSPAIDTSPTFSPDGRHVVFNSDRGGTQQLYVMDADGGNVRRITFGEARYATPVWSPRGDQIAFTKISEGRFYIGVMRPDGTGERLLASSYLVESPTWAPNGRVLLYFKQTASDRQGRGGSVKLYSIDLTGYNERQIATPRDGSDPAWSPLLR